MTPFILAFFSLGDPTSIHKARMTQNQAIASGDREKVASYWTEDITLRRGLGAPLFGKEAYLAILDPQPSLIYVRIPDTIDVSPIWPLAYESGTWSAHRGDGIAVITGKYSAQWVKRDSSWLIRSEVFVALDGSEEVKSWPFVP